MGVVYLARQIDLDLQRALKVVRADFQSEAAIKRFRREALAMSRLHHQSIVQILDLGQLDNGWPYLAMEYVDGPDLQRYVDERGPQPLATGLLILRQLAAALSYAVVKGVVHRDLKPQNIVLRNGDPEQVKVIDFGLAKVLSDEQLTRLTEEGQILGSPLYMAPEQAAGSKVGPPADVYALAGIAYFLLSGDSVFTESKYRNAIKLVVAHCHNAPERLSSRCPELQCPPLLDNLLMASLDKKPENRPTAEELVGHFDRLYLQAKTAAGKPGRASAATKPTLPMLDVPSLPASDSALSLADQLWGSPSDLSDSNLVEACRTQIGAVMMDLARALAPQLSATSPLHHHLSQVTAKLESLDKLELDRALIESQLEEPGAAPELRTQHKALREKVEALQLESRRHCRRIFDMVMELRITASESSTQELSNELEALLAQYQDAVQKDVGNHG